MGLFAGKVQCAQEWYKDFSFLANVDHSTFILTSRHMFENLKL